VRPSSVRTSGLSGSFLAGEGVAEVFAHHHVVGDVDDAGEEAALGGEGHGVVMIAGDKLEGAGEFPLVVRPAPSCWWSTPMSWASRSM